MGNKAKEKKKIHFKEILLITVILLLSVNLIKSFMKLRERQKIVREMKIKIVEEKLRQDNLKRELAQAESQEFIEKQARDKLNMAKEGELIILLPSPVLSPSPTPFADEASANWQKWVKLFW